MGRGDLIESVGGVATRRDDRVPFGCAWVMPSLTGQLWICHMSTKTAAVLAADCLCAAEFRAQMRMITSTELVALTGEHWLRATRRVSGDLPSELDDAYTEAELVQELDDLS